MWTFHPEVGFFSAVEDRQTPGNILVRFRDPGHAKAFVGFIEGKAWHRQRPKIRETPNADYRWKLSITHEIFDMTVERLARRIDYDNFKGRCGKSL
jgi:hypothetical protein